MTANNGTQPDESNPGPDLEYDLAHDVPEPVAHGRGVDDDRAIREPVRVVNATDDDGGDYSYDLAHDVPR